MAKKKKEMTLAFVRLKGIPGEKILIGFKTKEFFEITRPAQIFVLNWEELSDPNRVDPPEPPPAPGTKNEKYVNVSVLLLFRRIE